MGSSRTEQILSLFGLLNKQELSVKEICNALLEKHQVEAKRQNVLSRLTLLKKAGKLENVATGIYRLITNLEHHKDPQHLYFFFIKEMQKRHHKSMQGYVLLAMQERMRLGDKIVTIGALQWQLKVSFSVMLSLKSIGYAIDKLSRKGRIKRLGLERYEYK